MRRGPEGEMSRTEIPKYEEISLDTRHIKW